MANDRTKGVIRRRNGSYQIVPSKERQVAKLERYLRVLPADHPKRSKYEKQLRTLRETESRAAG